MIQPINASTPRAVFRGSNRAYERSKLSPEAKVALVNAGGIASLAGGVTLLTARAYTNSFAHAGVIGLCVAFLTMFFMSPQILEKAGVGKYAAAGEAEHLLKEDSKKFMDVVKEHVKPTKKAIHFRQQA